MQMKSTLTFLLAMGVSMTAFGQDFSDAKQQAAQSLEQAMQDYAELQEKINAEKPKLAARLDVLEQDVLELRRQNSDAQRVQASVSTEFSSLERDKQQVIDNNTYIQSTLLNEYFRRFELTVNPAEIQLYQEDIKNALQVMDAEDASERPDDASIFRRQLQMLSTVVSRLETSMGGRTFQGTALVEGTIKPGAFFVSGPASYFATEDGSAAGMTNGMVDNRANIYLLPDYQDFIATAVTTGEGELPIDATGGEALESDRYSITMLEEIGLGGMVMYPIIILFVAAMLVALFKFFELAGVKTSKESDLVAILDQLRQGNTEAAMAHAKSVGGPVGRMLATGVEHSDEDKEVIEEVLYEEIIKTQPKLERYLPFIAVVAATAPLLGLLGTVTGMIKTFKLITIVGTGDARNLSSGISEALITTKYGLIVAIPSLILHALLNRKAKGVVGSMEQVAIGFVNGIAEMRDEQSRSEG